MNSKPLVIILFYFFLSVNIFAQTSDLSLNVLAENESPNIRSTIKFTITILNSGPDEATDVSVVNKLASGYRIDSISDNGITAGNTISWHDLKIAPHTNIYLHFNAKVLSYGAYYNQTEIVASGSYDPDSDPEMSFDLNDLDDRYSDDDEFELTSITPIPSNFDKDNLFDKDDIDDDNDGIPDTYESNGINPDADLDNDGTPVYLDDNDTNFDIGDADELTESFFDLDGDNIPNHFDYDSDNDGILDIYEAGYKNLEFIFEGKISASIVDFGLNGLYNALETSPNSGKLITALLNTDNDDNLNFLDADDDNDGLLTKDENADPNGDGNPEDAFDMDEDGIPDYLDSDTTVSAKNAGSTLLLDEDEPKIKTATIVTKNAVVDIKLFTKDGIEVTPEIQKIGNLVQLDISNLESGVYFLQFKTGNKVDIKRMVID